MRAPAKKKTPSPKPTSQTTPINNTPDPPLNPITHNHSEPPAHQPNQTNQHTPRKPQTIPSKIGGNKLFLNDSNKLAHRYI